MAVSRVFHSSAPELKKSWAGNKVQSVSTETEIPLTFSEFWSLKPPQFPPLRRVEAAALWDYYYYFFSLVDVAGAGSSSSVLQEASAWLHTGPCRQPWGFLLCSHRTVRLQKWISINRSLSPGLFFYFILNTLTLFCATYFCLFGLTGLTPQLPEWPNSPHVAAMFNQLWGGRSSCPSLEFYIYIFEL